MLDHSVSSERKNEKRQLKFTHDRDLNILQESLGSKYKKKNSPNLPLTREEEERINSNTDSV